MNRRLNKKKIILMICIVLIIALVITFSILYQNNVQVRLFLDEYVFRKNITENTLPKISTDNSHSFVFNDHIVCLDKNVLTFYNKSANKVDSIDVEISDPLFATNGKYLCIAEKNGSKIYLISGKNVVWQKDVEGQISNLSLNKNGYVAVSISGTTYTTVCRVYDENGNDLFTNYLSKSYVIDSAISNDNKFLALAETNFSGIAIQSNIKIISIDKALTNSSDTIQYSYSAPIGDFVINIEYSANDDLVCLYDNHIDIVKDNSVSEITSFANSNILFADINNKLIQIEKRNTGMLSSEFELQIIDISTLERKVYALDKEPKSLEVFGNVIAVNFGTEVLFINNSSWLIKNYTSSQEIQSIILSNNLAGIVFNDKVEILDL